MWLHLIFWLVLALLLTDFLRKRRRLNFISRTKISGAFPLPIIGTAYEFKGMNSENVFQFVEKKLSNKQKTCYFWLFNRLLVISANAKDMEALLGSTRWIEKAPGYDTVADWLGDGLLISKGKKWHQRRKIITPTFHFKILEEFVKIFDKQADILVNKLAKHADGVTPVNIYDFVCLASMDIIAESAMGVEVGAQSNPDFGYVKAVKEAAAIFSDRFRSPILQSDLLFRLLEPTKCKKLKENIKFMHSFTEEVIKKRRIILERKLESEQEKANVVMQEQEINEHLGNKKRVALLDMLLQATIDGEPLNNEDIREEVETFMFEGHDTTTSGVSFALYAISRHPEVQQRIFDEIRQVIGDDKQGRVSLRDLQDCKYLDCVVKEALRLYPPVPVIGRYFSEDVDLNGKIFPAGTIYNISIFRTLRDPEYFTNPTSFMPERFAAERSAHINPFAYIPFSAGSRNCVGQKFAMLELKSTISQIIRHFELLPLGTEPVLSSMLTLRSSNGVNLGLRPRIYA